MDRSLAGRMLIGRVGAPLRPSAPRAARGRGTAAARARSLRHPLRTALAFVYAHRRLRSTLLCAVLALPLLAGGWLLLRNSPLVSVEHVRVSGVQGPQAQEIETALVAAARGMSTLDVHPAALSAAVARFHVVSSIRTVASFPHSLRIEVTEQPAVAALVVDGARTAVAADGVALGPALLSSSLPTLAGYSLPRPGARVRGPNVLAALAILGAAPEALARHVSRVYAGPEGLTVVMSNGLLAYFGDGSRPHAKWISLASVLADPGSAGASYIDVRLPARPAAGFPAGVAPPAASGEAQAAGETSALTGSGGSEATVGALAAGLSSTTGTTPASSPSEPSSASAGAPESQAAGGAESQSASEPQAGTGAGSEAAGGGTASAP